MFELYSLSVNPDDPAFRTYLQEYVTKRDPRSPDSIPYSELYAMIKAGIREYIHQKMQAERKTKK